MASDDIFALIIQQLATIMSIFGITISTAIGLNKSFSGKMDSVREQVYEKMLERDKVIDDKLGFIQRDIERLDKHLEKVDERARFQPGGSMGLHRDD
jgi:hypothetical protein